MDTSLIRGELGDLGSQGAPGVISVISAHKSGATLERFAFLCKKVWFHYVFLKVRAPGTVICDKLLEDPLRAGSGRAPPAHYQDRQNPYS